MLKVQLKVMVVTATVVHAASTVIVLLEKLTNAAVLISIRVDIVLAENLIAVIAEKSQQVKYCNP